MPRLPPLPDPPPTPPAVPVYDLTLRREADLALLRKTMDVPVSYRSLGREPYSIHARGTVLGPIRFWETRSDTGFRCLPQGGDALLVLRLPTAGTIRRTVGRESTECRVGAGLLTTLDNVRVTEASPGVEAFSCTLDRAVVERAAADLAGREEVRALDFLPHAEIATPSLRALRENLAAATRNLPGLAAAARPDIGIPLLAELFVYQLVAAWPTQGGAARILEAEPSGFRRALDYIDAHLARPITVAEVAQAADCGVRGLQNAFRRELGCSPVRFIIERRLQRVREDLLAGSGVSVSQVAYRWGFTHMSDFARRYGQRFGETPAQTLRRR